MRWIFFFILVLCNRTWAQCPKVDIRDKYKDCPVFDNVGGGYCYAHTAASLLTAYYGICVSPASLVAADTRLKQPDITLDDLKSGHTLLALYGGLRSGFCSSREVFEMFGTNNILTAIGSNSSGVECSSQSRSIQELLKNANEINDNYVFKHISDLANAKCTQQRKALFSFDEMPRSHTFEAKDGLDINIIVERLSSGNAVGVNYNAAFMLDKKIDMAPHATTIIGIRKKNNRCEVLLRNSWGKDCNVGVYKLNSKFVCKQGNVWIPWEELKSHMWDVDVIYRKEDYIKKFGKEEPKFNFDPPRL